MPEGDTLHRAARRLGLALTDQVLVEVTGSHRAVRREGRRLRGHRVTGVEAIGKHLLVHTDNGWSLRTHLGMTGRWHVYEPHERWKVTEGKARVVLRVARAVAVCFAAPTVEVAPTQVVLAGLERLGPDLAKPDPPLSAVVERARNAGAATLADLLLDQAVASGIGNVYKSEVLFLEGLGPASAPEALDNDTLRALFARAHRLLRGNLGDGNRSTTGTRGRGNYWVYGRAGRPCRRCATPIASDRHGPLARVTYWCPRCQPQRSASSRNAVNG